MIPEEKNDVVTRALLEAFGASKVDDIRRLTGGLSRALVFRIVVRGRPYMLRLIMNTGAAVGPGQGDQTHHFACMKAAADAGIGPLIRYTSAEDGISITDFVEARPLPRTEALALLPHTLRTLHALPPFPSPRVVNYLGAMDGFVRGFQSAEILPASETAGLFELYAQLKDIPRAASDMVLCHNDLRPENILSDGDHVWLIDWEAAFANDRNFDLAVTANFIVTNADEEETYLRAYFGDAAFEQREAYRRARFYLTSQLLHVFYAAFLMLTASKGKPIETNAKVREFRDFHDRLWAREIDLADDQMKIEYGRVHMNEILRNGRTARFQAALRIVSDSASN